MFLQNNIDTKESKLIFGFLLIFTFFSIALFDPVFLQENKIPTYIYAALNILLLPYVVYGYFQKSRDYMFMGAMKLLNISVIISVFCSYYFWNQPMRDAVLAILYPVAGYNLYFYLVRKNVQGATIERIIFIMGILSVGAFLVSFVIYPRQLFFNQLDFGETASLERGLQRIQLAGFGFIYLFFFMSLNRIFTTDGIKMKWIILASVSYLCILLSLTRTYVAFSTVIALIYLFRNSKFYIKGLIAGGVIVAAFVIPNLEFVQNMVQMTKEDLGSSKDYVRVQAAQYFLSDFQPSPVTRILGNGIEYGENDYGVFIQRVGAVKGYFIGDLGLIGLYIYLGVLAVAAYVIIFYKGFKEKLSADLNYLKMFIAFILLIGLNSFATYNTSFLLAIVFVVYLYEVNRRNQNEVPVTEDWDSQLEQEERYNKT